MHLVRRQRFWAFFALLFLVSHPALAKRSKKSKPFAPSLEDEYKWLVPLNDDRAVAWTREQTKRTEKAFAEGPRFETFKKEILAIVNSEEKVSGGIIRGDYLYASWKDKSYPAGVWKRISLKDYNAKKKKWETLLDVGKLNKEEGKVWKYMRSNCLGPAFERCMVQLSLEGADLVETREFSVSQKKFLKDGFFIPLARTQTQWMDENQIFVTTNFGPGTTNPGGYPLRAHLWKRGQPLANTETVFTPPAKADGVFLDEASEIPNGIFVLGNFVAFRDREYYLYKDGRFKAKLALPLDASLREVRGNLGLIHLQGAWHYEGKKFPKDSILVVDLKSFLDTGKQRYQIVYTPGTNEFVSSTFFTKEAIYAIVFDNDFGKLLSFKPADQTWERSEVSLPSQGTVSDYSASPDSTELYIIFENFLTPRGVYRVTGGKTEPLFIQPAAFEATNLSFSIHRAKSKDGTEVPYFVIGPKNLLLNGQNPTLLWGYGAGNVPSRPIYVDVAGKAWLEKGGVYVLSILRGSGDRGPEWRRQGMKRKKQNTFDDFVAIAQDLIKQKITSPQKLGILGASWGGLLVSAAFIQNPKLFGAVEADVPMLDMLNFTLLGTGSGWTGELGDPNHPEDRKVLQSYSPYHRVKADAEYPPVLFLSATNDDRMHTAHARRMAAKMLNLGHNVYYWESRTGGHALSTDNESLATVRAIRYTFFADRLGLFPKEQRAK